MNERIEELVQGIAEGSITMNDIDCNDELRGLYMQAKTMCDEAFKRYEQRNAYELCYALRDRDTVVSVFCIMGDVFDGEIMSRKVVRLLQQKTARAGKKWRCFNGAGERPFSSYNDEEIVLLDERSVISEADWRKMIAPEQDVSACRVILYVTEQQLATYEDRARALSALTPGDTMAPLFNSSSMMAEPVAIDGFNTTFRAKMAGEMLAYTCGEKSPLDSHTRALTGYDITHQRTRGERFSLNDCKAAYRAAEEEFLVRFMVYRVIMDNTEDPEQPFTDNDVRIAEGSVSDGADLDETLYKFAQRAQAMLELIRHL